MSADEETAPARGDGTDRLLAALYGSAAGRVGKAPSGSVAYMLHDAANEILRLESDNARLRELCRRLEVARGERDAYRRDLEEIGRLLGCGHVEGGLARCVRDRIAGAPGGG